MTAMLNQAHVEAICSATYLENYLDTLDALPDDLQRILTQIREVDMKICELDTDCDTMPFEEILSKLSESDNFDQKLTSQLQRILIKMQEYEDEKIQLSATLMEYIESRTRQLDCDRENLDPANHVINEPAPPALKGSSSAKRSFSVDAKSSAAVATNTSNAVNQNVDAHKDKPSENRSLVSSTKKRKQRSIVASDTNSTPATKATNNSNNSTSNSKTPTTPANTSSSTSAAKEKEKEETPARKTATPVVNEDTSSRSSSKAPLKRKRRSRVGSQAKSQKEVREPSPEPGEPTYCLCDQVSYGEMIGCDNNDCTIEWFHFNCVGLVNKPKGKWYCPKCRGDKPTVMKKK